MNTIVKDMPAAEDHVPLSVLNPTSQGIRTMLVCSCGWVPAKAPSASSTMCNSHMAHRRREGVPRFDYSNDVFGEGPWMGLTWDEWYGEHGGTGIDPYTGDVSL